MKLSIIPVSFLLTIASITYAETGKPVLKLWYRQPAAEWMQATPDTECCMPALPF